MSMNGNLLRVSEQELNQYLENSTLLEERVYPEEYIEDPYLLDLDKCWENIYFLLTGCTSADSENAIEPLALIFFNGSLIDEDQDMGYGPATYCNPDQVKDIFAALPNSNKEKIRALFESLKSVDVPLYPFRFDSEDLFEYVFDIIRPW